MIFYFSGTGNSRWAARELADSLGEELRFIPDELGSDMRYVMRDGERLGFVFPCYAWGVPLLVENFIRRLSVGNVGYVYYLCTCGDDTGMTKELFCRIIESKGWHCHLGFDIQMPESYISLPGFDVDTKEKERAKLEAAAERIKKAVSAVGQRQTDCFDVLPGAYPWMKSRVVRPFFNRFLMSPKPFRYTDKCISCGKCAASCPLHNISLADRKHPVWHEQCAGCLRCYHVCPVNAVQYGWFTRGKGQYMNPSAGR
ncbi:MAG: EFR1 family ferrodoxin [Bacteroides sp.]|nr:EFR1 family ferrodoxin [Roseburia sp.]MCM1347695.1 EFR1 family ferrodoxin [Bacteroides sp.]MCM1422116.1 EFR1 family ferrodoxin [Bacteroides sp.]